MTEITEICMIDLEHQLKVEPKSTKRASASVTTAETDQSDKGKKTLVSKNTKTTTESRQAENLQLVSQELAQVKSLLTPLTTQVCELFGAVERLNQQDAHAQ